MIRPRRVVLAIALAAQPLAAQGPDTLVVVGDRVARAAAVRDHGYAAYPVTLLEALGAEVRAADEYTEVKLFGLVLRFHPGYGTFAVNSFITLLYRAAFERDGVLYVPDYFFVDWLPNQLGRWVGYDARTATLATRAAIARAEQQAAARRGRAAPAGREVGQTTPARAPAAFDEPPPSPRDRPQPRRGAQVPAPVTFQMHVRLSGSYFDNFFHVPSSGPETNLLASTAEARLLLRIENPRAHVYARVSGTAFDGYEPSKAVLGGFDWSGARHSVEATAGYQQRNPRLHVGDQPGFANVRHGTAAYGLVGPGRLQLSALAHYYDVALNAEAADNRFYGAGGALRYRGFGYRFAPEVGAMRSRWDAPREADAYDEHMFWLSLRAVPAAPLYLHTRYRRGMRVYVTGDPDAGNFEREDARHHVTLTWDLKLNRRLAWGGYYTYEEVHSTRSDRTLGTQSITSSISVRVW